MTKLPVPEVRALTIVDQKHLAAHVLKHANINELARLGVWLQELLSIRAKEGSFLTKSKAAIKATQESKIVWPLLKMIAGELRKHGWDKRSRRTRWTSITAAVSMAFFGGQSAGVAALGGAIGVPLWVVFGGGAAFALTLLDEIAREANNNPIVSPAKAFGETHAIIEGNYIDLSDQK